MDAFYASIEQRDNPLLRGKPVVVGGSKSRGVVAAASYEARKYGIHSAMPSAFAIRRCPHLTFIKPRFDAYRGVSEEIRNIFLSYTALVEPLSLDEAYLDITQYVKSIREGEEVARTIRKEIRDRTQLNASAGISFNKFLAKMASDEKKPNGQFTIFPSEAEAFLRALPVRKFHGIGSATAQKMNELGIVYGKDLILWSLPELVRRFGKAGKQYYHIVRGEDVREVNPNRIRKSIGVERTFGENLYTQKETAIALENITQLLAERVSKYGKSGKTLTLKMRYADFKTITRSKTLPFYFDEKSISLESGLLLQGVWQQGQSIRLLGLTITNLEREDYLGQLKLDL